MSKIDNYNKIRNSLNTGDIVLFSGKGCFSEGIKAFTWGKWSHIGMVLKIPEYNFVCLWESTTLSKIKDIEKNEYIKGVQLAPLSKKILTYEGDIGIRQLKDVKLSKKNIKDLMFLRQVIKNTPYEKKLLDLAGSAFHFLSDNLEDISSLFCSEMVAEAYQTLKLVSNKKPSDEYHPNDFGRKEGLDFLRGKLGKIINL